MRFIAVVIAVLFAALVDFAQGNLEANNHSRVKQELRKLFGELNEAFQKGDRKALERIYAEEFIWVHGTGYIDDKNTHITDSLSVEVRAQLPIPTFDQLFVLGDVAISREMTKTRATNSLFGTSVFVRRDGRWQVLQVQGTPMLPERKVVEVDVRILDSYAGRYENDAKESLKIIRDGKSLVVALQRPGVPRRMLIPTSEVQFFDKLGSEYIFRKGEDGRIAHFDFRLNNREAKWKKVE